MVCGWYDWKEVLLADGTKCKWDKNFYTQEVVAQLKCHFLKSTISIRLEG